jgi:hypothetical protein
LQSLYQEFPGFNITGRLITEQYYIRSEKRAIDLQTLPAKQRYEKLLADYPGILQKASLGQIASYLSIKQETLSRIRGMKLYLLNSRCHFDHREKSSTCRRSHVEYFSLLDPFFDISQKLSTLSS